MGDSEDEGLSPRVQEDPIRSWATALMGCLVFATLHLYLVHIHPKLSGSSSAPNRATTGSLAHRFRSKSSKPTFWLLMALASFLVMIIFCLTAGFLCHKILALAEGRQLTSAELYMNDGITFGSGVIDSMLLGAQITRLHAVLSTPGSALVSEGYPQQRCSIRRGYSYVSTKLQLRRWILPTVSFLAIVVASIQCITPILQHLGVPFAIDMTLLSVATGMVMISVITIDSIFMAIIVKSRRHLRSRLVVNIIFPMLLLDIALAVVPITVFAILQLPNSIIAFKLLPFAKATATVYHIWIIIVINHCVAQILQRPIHVKRSRPWYASFPSRSRKQDLKGSDKMPLNPFTSEGSAASSSRGPSDYPLSQFSPLSPRTSNKLSKEPVWHYVVFDPTEPT